MHTTLRDWKVGDKVLHPGKPEWGVGQILSAEHTTQDGKRCQRLSVRFDRVGSKQLTTAFATLVEASDYHREDLADAHMERVLGVGSGKMSQEELGRLPEAATDPFLMLPKRVNNTLALYRFTPEGGSLLDWAILQTSLKDPLSHYSRHELETAFRRFQNNLDQHLRKIVKDLKRQDPGALTAIVAAAGPAAKQALRRADIDR